jgi:acyl-CoA dehydrogenase
LAIDFSPSWMDETLDIHRQAARRFAETEIAPAEEKGRAAGNVGHAIWRRAGELGFLLADVPEDYGGAGGDFRHEAVFYEETSRRGLSGMNTAVHSIVAHYFLNHGTEEQKRAYLPRLASGELVAAIAMTEPDTGSDLQAIRTKAAREGNGYTINGAKTFISNGFLAGLVLVVCKTDAALGARGTSIMIVETKDCEGFRVGRVLDKVGLKAQDTSELFFDNVRVPADHLLGGVEGQGFFQMMSDLPYERLIVSVAAVAAIEGAFEATLKYTRDRKAFGKPILEFQNTRFKLAEVAAIAKAARAYLDRSIEDYLAGRLDTVAASMLKMWTTEQQNKTIDECLQLFGGFGYMNESLIARMWADARVARIYAGTNEIMREVVARGF